MFNKLIDLLSNFNSTFCMLLSVLIFAMSGILEGMLLFAVLALVVFIMELLSCIQKFRKNKRRKERTHGNQKVT